jgi:hypothetical protein
VRVIKACHRLGSCCGSFFFFFSYYKKELTIIPIKPTNKSPPSSPWPQNVYSFEKNKKNEFLLLLPPYILISFGFFIHLRTYIHTHTHTYIHTEGEFYKSIESIDINHHLYIFALASKRIQFREKQKKTEFLLLLLLPPYILILFMYYEIFLLIFLHSYIHVRTYTHIHTEISTTYTYSPWPQQNVYSFEKNKKKPNSFFFFHIF